MIVHDPENELQFLAMEPSKTWQEIRGTWPCCFKVKATVYQLCLCKATFIAREKFPPTKILVSRHLCLPGLCDINEFPVSATEVLRHRLVRERRVRPTPFLWWCQLWRSRKGEENKWTHHTGALNWRSCCPLHLLHLPVNDGGNTELDLYPIVNNTTWLQVILPCARLIPSCLIYTSYLASCRLQSLSA